jgi:large subunit ribosomal protein L9
MKVILDKDMATLGEVGDVKDVARGYARNFLFPRGIALPYNEKTIKLFEARKEEIEEHKAQKRQDASGLKEKLEALSLALIMPAGANGKLYGAVTAQTVADELGKQGFQIERKRIEIPGNTIKSVGKYRIAIKLYESAAAECSLTIEGQPVKIETKTPPPQRGRRRDSRAGADNPPREGAVSAVPEAQAVPAEAAVPASTAAFASATASSTDSAVPANSVQTA